MNPDPASASTGPPSPWPRHDPTPAAVFLDVDGTLLPDTTTFLFARHLHEAGLLPRRVLWQSLWHGLQHRAGRLDYARLIQNAIQQLRSIPLVQLQRLAYESFVARVKPRLFPGIVDHVAHLRNSGALLALASSSPGFVLEPLALYLQIDHLITTPLQTSGGRITGVQPGPLCYGPGKLQLAAEWAAEQGIAMDEAIAYSDNWSDLALLRGVGRAVVVRPGLRLARVAKKEDWPTVNPRRIPGH